MLRSIRLRNFRSLRDTGDVELRPIVLLVGGNDTGKSSLLRFFPLLEQTARAAALTPLLWYADAGDVDFGEFSQTLLRGAADPWIEVSAATAGPGRRTGWPLQFTARIVAGQDGRSRVERLVVECLGDSVSLDVAPDGGLVALRLNDVPLPAVAGVRLVQRTPGPILHLEGDELVAFTVERIVEVVAAQVEGKLTLDELVRIVETIAYGPGEHLLASLGSVRGGRFWRDAMAGVTADGELVCQIKALAFLRQLDRALEDLADAVRDHARGVRYLGPFRRPPQRYHRRTEFGLGQLGRDGSNLAMLLDALPAAERDAFSAWLRRHFGFGAHAERLGAHVCVMVDQAAQHSLNVADTGCGTAELLPVVAQCWLAGRHPHIPDTGPATTLLAVEQPELHLHPSRQAPLADMFLATARALADAGQSACLCIETHSEAMLRRFGQLVAAGAVRPDELTILRFDPDGDATTVVPLAFAADGTLPGCPTTSPASAPPASASPAQ
ncbi:MAG: AAA family ATPase [Myxococcales bacterium]|nr:AAA family ATPase [Myxococcales bacterium]